MEFPFDRQVKESDPVGKAVIHVWAGRTLQGPTRICESTRGVRSRDRCTGSLPVHILFKSAVLAGAERFGRRDSRPGARGYRGPKIRLLPGGGTAGGCIRSNRTTGPRGPAFRGGHADFDDPGDVVQLRKFSQNGEPRRRGARMAAEAGGEEAHAAAVHAEA